VKSPVEEHGHDLEKRAKRSAARHRWLDVC
jgi:hypothetical protein